MTRVSIQRRRESRVGSSLRLLMAGTVSLVSALAFLGWYAHVQREYVLHPVEIGAAGMEPTLAVGDVVMGEGGSLRDRAPAQGDIVIFVTDGIPLLDEKKNMHVVQRIAAVAGDRVELQPGRVIVNGSEFTTGTLHYDGTAHPGTRDAFTVPGGYVFTLGDNTTVSTDGRTWGLLPLRNILYRAWFRYWPPQRAGAMR